MPEESKLYLTYSTKVGFKLLIFLNLVFET